VISEIDLFGVLLNPALFSALLAGALHLGLRGPLAWTGFYRWVWHRGLADLAVYIIVWAGVTAATPRITALLTILNRG
jgi:Protein of unknown function (DUF1656)